MCAGLGFSPNWASAQASDDNLPESPSSHVAQYSGHGNDAASQREVSWKSLPKDFFYDQKEIWTFPVRLGKAHNWVPTLAVIGGTAGLIYADPPQDLHNAGYYATAPSLFRGAMELWQGTLAGTGYTPEDYTLVDIGCGKGRVLMLASEYAFREIVGVELDPRLAGVARRNLRKWMKRSRGACLPDPKTGTSTPLTKTRSWGPRTWGTPRVRIIEGDALELSLPDGPVALFYFNSFEFEMTQMWLASLAELGRSRTHPLDLIYIHPEFDALVRQAPGMRVLAEADVPLSEEDAAADVFGVSDDRVAIYRLSG